MLKSMKSVKAIKVKQKKDRAGNTNFLYPSGLNKFYLLFLLYHFIWNKTTME